MRPYMRRKVALVRYDPDRHRRRSIRLRKYDYSRGGLYFITICTHQRECLFGNIADGTMHLSALGEVAGEEWRRSAALRPALALDAFVVMPNHVHGIVTIVEPEGDVGAHSNAPRRHTSLHRAPRSVATFVGGFKGAVTRRVNALRGTTGTPVWQRNYYERVIRDEDEFERILWYIEDNPRRWAEDEYNPSR
jgi:REP element-mobilizing transposase RayT